MTLTTEAVRALAPDASALRAAQSLSSPARWSALGRNERALWGNCQGSGKDPYQVSVDLGGETIAARCTCPSRKFPCKHGLGLLLMATTNAAALPAGAPPAGTADWLAGRDARATSGARRGAVGATDDGPAAEGDGPPAKIVDEKARAKRIATREKRVESGLEELRLWLRDLARRGLAEVVTEGVKPFEAMAARLVGAQAASVARSVRGVGWRVAGAGVTPDVADVDWADDLLDVMGRTYLLAETYARRQTLPEAMQAEVRTLVGWTVREAELPDDDVVEDTWLVLGRRHTGDERLRATRTYLRGQTSGRDAVLLDWAPAGNAAPNEPPVGARVRGRLVFYPSATPLRAAIRGILEPADAAGGEGGREGPTGAPATWREAIAPYATALGANPWLERRPILVAGVMPAVVGEEIVYRDGAGETVPMRLAEGSVESLQAFSGGRPVTLFGEWNGRAFTALAAGDGEAWVALAGTTDINPTVVVGAGSPPSNAAWDALRAYAILGTSRASPAPELAPLVARMADRNAEDQLLSLAASLGVRRRAQAAPVTRPQAAPLPPAPPELSPRASVAAARVLGEWLGEAMVVRDWLDRAASAGVRVPAELLPQVAQVAGVTRRRDAEAVLGRRWAWLAGAASGTGDVIATARAARSVAELREALGDPAASKRYGGELGEALRPFRAHDAAAARGWLEAAWPVLSAKGRDGAVKALAEGLSGGDAAFLDRLIEDERSKARKEDLVALACRVPGSAVRERIEGRAKRLVGMKGLLNRSIDITPPGGDELAAMERDGMTLPSYGPVFGAALRAAAIVEHAAAWHLARVDPSRWLEWLRLKPEDLVTALLAVKRVGHLLVDGLRQAAIAHRDPVIAEAILGAQPTGGYSWLGQELWGIVRDDQRERLMVKVLFDRTAKDWFEIASLQEALESVPRPWSPSLLTLVRHEIRRSVEHTSPGPAMIGRNRLAVIATHAPTELLGEIEDAVAIHAPRQDNPAAFDDVLRIIVARRSLDAAFAPTPATQPGIQP